MEPFEEDPQIERWLKMQALSPVEARRSITSQFAAKVHEYQQRKKEHQQALKEEQRAKGVRSTMSNREKSAYIRQHGADAYLALPW
ncbi:MAG TPA: hypothetical protein VEF04_06230 [Blastocatellia bacterium]|nr:hypothetical protein [Blastocatellia bacterium]